MDYFCAKLWFLVCLMVHGGQSCGNFTDCTTCTNTLAWKGQHCIWCAVDRACYTYESVVHTCKRGRTIEEPSKCYGTAKGTYTPDTAFSLALLSAVSYSDNSSQCMDRIYPDSGFNILKVFSQSCETLPLFRYAKCFAFIAISPGNKTINLAYRGTDFAHGSSQQLYDEMFSILTVPKMKFPTGGNVQAYFKKAHDKLYPSISVEIKNLVKQYPDYTVTITGHSLGAALASLSAALLVYEGITKSDTTALYAFGMPRVGDKAYALQHDKLVVNSWRVVHARDIVSHLPTCNVFAGCVISTDRPYHHGTEVYYPKSEMYVNSTYVICKQDEDKNCSDGAVEHKWCIPGRDLDQCIYFHKHYFNVAIGTACGA